MQTGKKVALIILDGWGIGAKAPKINAIEAANTPFMDSLMARYPHASLNTFGSHVGLPEGQMGNSEVGHLNIGAGRVVYQMLALINKAFVDGEVNSHPVLREAMEYARREGKNVHLLGLVSDGGVHSSLEHLKGLCSLFAEEDIDNVFIHAFTDGRDTDPKGGVGYLTELQQHLNTTTGRIATVIGRYYSMDRDKRWERTKLAYDLLVHGKGETAEDAVTALQQSYDKDITDEFVKPVIIAGEDGKPLATIKEGDVVLFFNFRTDRGRQLTTVLSQQPFPEQDMQPLNLNFITMSQYDKTFRDVKVLFGEQDLKMTLGEAMEKEGKTQLRMAETEKYPHVTFFFSGGRETPFEGERRILMPSPKVATYDMQPEMSAIPLAEAAVKDIHENRPDLLVLNFANPDMVGHTGVFSAVVKAIETVDNCARQVVEACLKEDYSIIVTADHGNADFMVNPDGTPNTAHTTNPVPVILVGKEERYTIRDGKLGDLAPTLLTLMGLPVPQEMTGVVLLEAKMAEPAH